MNASIAIVTLLFPSLAAAQDHHLYWGSIHEHSTSSRPDYLATPDELYLTMLAEADLDFGAVTDYDWSLVRGTWLDAAVAANRFHCPSGRAGCYDDVENEPGFEALATLGDRPFVTLLAYEWNNNAPTPEQPGQDQYGHRNVYWMPAEPEGDYPQQADAVCEPGPDCISLVPSGEGESDEREDWASYHEPCRLWEGLLEVAEASGATALTAPHHPALSVTGWQGEAVDGRRHPTSTDPAYSPEACGLDADDPVAEGLVELYSVWGNHEHAALDAIEEPADGLVDPERSVREGLLSLAGPGRRLGFLASGDSHHGRPGSDAVPSWLLDPEGDFHSYQFSCAPEADCELRFGHVGLVAALVPAAGERSEDLTRAGIFEALQARHTVATTGERFTLTVSVIVDGQVVGIQGDDLGGRGLLSHADEARLEIEYDLGEHAVQRLDLAVGDASGSWSERVVEGVEGSARGTADLPLVQGGAPEAWVPEGPWLLYARVAAEPTGGLVVPEGSQPLVLEEDGGAQVALELEPGAWLGGDLAASVDAQLEAAGLGVRLAWEEAEPWRFALHPRDGAEPRDLIVRGADAPQLARLLGFRDDQDSACPAVELPCVAAVEVDGGQVQERAWASPVWLGGDPGLGDSAEPGGGCRGCASGGSSTGPWVVLFSLVALVRRRERAAR
jgi:uncharacterized protein (TIGR03382 family)